MLQTSFLLTIKVAFIVMDMADITHYYKRMALLASTAGHMRLESVKNAYTIPADFLNPCKSLILFVIL